MKRNDIQIIQSSLMPSFYGTKAQPDSPVCMRSLLSSEAKIQNNFCDSFLDQREAYFFWNNSLVGDPFPWTSHVESLLCPFSKT